MVNLVKNAALNTCLFRKLCSEMNTKHLNLLYYTWVCWLSKGNVLANVFKLQEELKEFLNRQRKYKLKFCFRDSTFISKLAYLVDIFDLLNHLNLKLQRNINVLNFINALMCLCKSLKTGNKKLTKEILQCLRPFHL